MANARSRYHVFLSHNSADKPAVEELARRLQKAGLEPWLDKWNLIPGDPWQPAIEEALRDCATCAVFIGPSGFGGWQHEEMRAAIDRRVASRNDEDRFRVIPVLLPGAVRGDRSQLPMFLTATTWVEFRQTLDDAAAFRTLERAIRGLPPGPDQPVTVTECPYRGLEFFDVQHAPYFFGRAAVTDWLLSALRGTLSKQGPTRFLAIIGASGSGKSSLARAGLLAALHHGEIEGSADWPTAICRPGPRPLESLADALAKTPGVNLGQGLAADLIQQLIDALRARPSTLHLTTRATLGDAQPARRLVVLVDQFEELFTLCHDESERLAFIGNLLHAAQVTQGQTIVLLAMRADFYGKCISYPELSAAISEHQFPVGALTGDELREVIERPAQLVGCEFEPGLVELLVREVLNQPGSLPLLQYELLALWNGRQGRRINTADYQRVGKLEDVLNTRAEEVFGKFSAEQQDLCRRLLLRLTQPGEGTEDTKRRVPWHELSSSQDGARAIADVVKHLADERLITTGGSTPPTADSWVEVAHEALIRSWKRLCEWIEADRAGLRVHRRLTEAAEEWAKTHLDLSLRDHTLLYDGTRLAVAKEWADKHGKALNDLERDFLNASWQLQEKEWQEKHRQELRLRTFLKAMLFASALAFAAAGIATYFWIEASRQAIQAERLRRTADLATRGELMLDSARTAQDAEVAGLLVLEALDREPGSLQAQLAFASVLEYYPPPIITQDIPQIWTTSHGVTVCDFSADGRFFALSDEHRRLQVLDVQEGKTVHTSPEAPPAITAVAFDPRGKLLIVGGDDGKAHILSVKDWKDVKTLEHGESLQAFGFISHGREFAAAGLGGTIQTWRVGTWDKSSTIKDPAGDAMSIEFSPDGQWIATKSWHSQIEENVVRIRDLASGRPMSSYLQGDPYSFALSRDGRYLAINGRDWGRDSRDKVLVYELGVRADDGRIEHHHVKTYPLSIRRAALAFDPLGQRIAIAADDTFRIFATRSGREMGKIEQKRVQKLAFVRDGDALAAAGNGRLRIWDFGAGRKFAQDLTKSNAPVKGNQYEKQIRVHLGGVKQRIGRTLTPEEREKYNLEVPKADLPK